MAPAHFDLCYLQGIYAPVEAAERTRDIAAFVRSQSNNISCVPISALITAAVEGKNLESLNVPRILLRIADCCSCAAEDLEPPEQQHDLKELAVACAAHLVSAATAWHDAAFTTGKRRRTNPLTGYKPSTLVALWGHIRACASAESSDALLLLLSQASSRMLPFTNSSDTDGVGGQLMTECLKVTMQQGDGPTCWSHPRSKSWLVSALPSIDEQALVHLLAATSKDEVLHTAASHAFGEELQRWMKDAHRNPNADSASASTSKTITTLLKATVAAAEAGDLASLLAIAPPSILSRCSKHKAAAVRKACCACFCAILKAQLKAPTASCRDAVIGEDSAVATCNDTGVPDTADQQHQTTPPRQHCQLSSHVMWALEHVAAMAEQDKDANVRLGVSHQICQLLTSVHSQGIWTGSAAVLSVYLQQVLGQLVQDSSAKVHAAAVKDMSSLLAAAAAAAGNISAEPNATHVRSLLSGPWTGSRAELLGQTP